MASAHRPKSTWLFQVPSRCAKNSLITGLLVRADKVMGVINSLARRRYDNLHFRALFYKSDDITGFISGNTACNAEYYFSPFSGFAMKSNY